MRTQEAGMSDADFQYFRTLIHSQTGIWLGDQKRTMLVSRLSRRLRELNLTTFAAYRDWLRDADPRGLELVQAINRVTTNKTDFFREPAHFTYLRDWLLRRRRPSVRIWCAASSTGEEPYTLAMTVAEVYGMDGTWQILASDIDTEVLEAAGRGIFSEDRLTTLPAGYQKSYFLRGRGANSGLACVRPQLRRHVEFQRINLVGKDWPERETFDAVFCRNVLIYFDRPTQERVVNRLLLRLAPDGLLFLGHSENLHSMVETVESVAHTVYRRRQGVLHQ
jgi:chemotaxis protein methyltransferase CheR